MREFRPVELGYTPRGWQLVCHQTMKRFSVLVLHRRAGKTRLAVAHLIHMALKGKKTSGGDNPSFIYLAPYLKQAKLLAWEILKRQARLMPNTHINEAELTITLPNHATIRVFGGDNPDALRGGGFDGVVLDELKDMKPELWYEIVRPALADRKGWCLFLGTPKGINLLSELFNFAATQDDWMRAIYTVYETEALPYDEIQALKAGMSDNEFRREFLCDFSASGEDQLISVADIEFATKRHYKITDYNFAAKVLGVDVARFGDDRSVLLMRQGLVAFPPISLQGVDNMGLASRIAQEITTNKIDAVFVDSGGGAGVIDRLRQMGHSVIEVAFGGSPLDSVFINRRSEMWWGIREWLDQGGALPPNVDLKQDLCSPTFSYTAQGKRKLEAKDDVKKRLLRSPDAGDALALTFAAPVAPPAALQAAVFSQNFRHEYDPFGEAK